MSEHICVKCGTDMDIPFDLDPTDYCNTCAQELVIELKGELERVKEGAAHRYKSVMEKFEHVQKQAAAMQEALESIAEDMALKAFGHDYNPMASRLGGIAAAALKPDASRDYVHKDRLVDALKSIETISEVLAMEKKKAAAMRHTLERLRNKLRKAPSAYSFPGVTSEFICDIERDVVCALGL